MLGRGESPGRLQAASVQGCRESDTEFLHDNRLGWQQEEKQGSGESQVRLLVRPKASEVAGRPGQKAGINYYYETPKQSPHCRN